MQFLFIIGFALGVNWTLLTLRVFGFADFLAESDEGLVDLSPEFLWENLEELCFGLRGSFCFEPFESIWDSVQMGVYWDAKYTLACYLKE